MKKVFIIHGYGGAPNGGWRPWLMGELDKQGIWAAALPMPMQDPVHPICTEWLTELHHHIEMNKDDEIYLVGHSLGATTVLRYLQSNMSGTVFSGVVLVSGPIESLDRPELENFLNVPFDYESISKKAETFSVIHGDNDTRVPLAYGERLAKALHTKLIVVENGGHLNGKSGWYALPQCLDALTKMMN